MTKPTTKLALIEAINLEHHLLIEALSDLSDEQMETTGACGDWSPKDILSHLTDWEGRFLHWYHAGVQGEIPSVPDENYTWGQLRTLNAEIYRKYKNCSLDDVRKTFGKSFNAVIMVLEGITEEELFSAGYYSWIGKERLVDYADANTASHYRWARKLIEKFRGKLVD